MIPPESGYREILLTQGKVTRLSYEDHEKFGKEKWSAIFDRSTGNYYAYRHSKTVNGKRHMIALHREILGLKYGDKRKADHAFHDTLDNRRFIDGKENLRIATDSESGMNRKIRSNNTSGFKGVDLHKQTGKWRAQIRVRGITIYLGLFVTKELAYAAYCEAAAKYHGEFACLA